MAKANRLGGENTAGSKSAAGNLARHLRERLAESRLPGDGELSPAQLDEVAEFLLEAAQVRPSGEAAILLRSAPDARTTRIALVNRDMPFLVDSVAAAVAAHGLSIDLLLHPFLPVQRGEDGALAGLPDRDPGELCESLIYLETPRTDAKTRRSLERELAATLTDVRAAVADWARMRDLLAREVNRMPPGEGAELLRWLNGGMMTHLGHVAYDRDGKARQRLGIGRKGARDLLSEESLGRAFAWFDGRTDEAGAAPLIVKANHVSRVHRRVPLDLFIVPRLQDGRVAALSVHAGIWTSAALATPPQDVPLLRAHLAAIGEKLGFVPGSHDGKALVHALTALPHDLLIGLDPADIARVATTMMSLADRPRPRLALALGPLKRHAFAFVWLPRDMIGATTQQHIQDLLERRTGADTLDWSLQVEGGNLALLRFVLDLRGRAEPDAALLDRDVQDLLRGWTDAVEEALGEGQEQARAAALAARYAPAFPDYYRTTYGAQEAALDIVRLRQAATGDRAMNRDARLHRNADAPADQLQLKVYQLGGSMPLSDAVPALENFGFEVLGEFTTKLADGDQAAIYDFTLRVPTSEQAGALLERAEAIEQAICAVLNGRAENDVFNRLVTAAALSAQEADWLRAIYRYLRQTHVAFTIYTVVDALARAPAVTRALIDLFVARHDPAFGKDREASYAEAAERVRAGLTQVAAINDDRLLRLYWSTIEAVLRTNAFAPAGAEALALKFDSARVPGLPAPVPWREIFVYSRRVEGIHLRAGPVARGGIRWSDRRDDFRTEILGLLKAQRVKNAVIVPTGAKGGFYPKHLPDPALDRPAWAAEGLESYKLFIRSLLSVTDNIEGGAVVHPAKVVIHDGDDPYFVVAADKGTASFSDTANAIAEEHGFWLGDAFASGGSKGYDHKEMGITARGAWISVQRHFRELGIDVQTEPVRVAGCGDMSGDVFGNGMLQSKAIKLVAAFDHRHVFIDPDPDPATSWKERKRLFDKPGSSWADYSETLISKGGGVFPRTQKRIALSPEAQTALGIEAAELDPEGLINAILKSPVDLLWFGGIGTYIKGSGETHPQVGDPANDRLRVSGDEVRATVIGEGANLGVTQAGRIEFALRGGRINTDFIDNSAGVDCSDNEVNIKIALNAAKAEGKLSERGRVALLHEMTDEVAALVLEDNRLQALALSVAEAGGAAAAPAYARLIDTLESAGELDRRTEGLADAETFRRRAGEGQGFTRPELAVLLSTAKLVLQDGIERCPIAEDEAMVPLLLSDFPPQMQRRFKKQLLAHRLRPQIVATVIANRMINRIGLIHPFELADEEGAPIDHVAAAFVATCGLLGLDALWSRIDQAEMPEPARLLLLRRTAAALRNHMADLLRSAGAGLSPSRLVGELAGRVGELMEHVDDLLVAEPRGHVEAISASLVEAGAPADLAATVANLFALDGAIGLAGLARDSGIAPVPLTRAFTDLGDRLGLGWAQSTAAVMSPSDPWERLLVAGLARDFQQMRLDFLRTACARGGKRQDPVALVAAWAARHAGTIRLFRDMVSRARAPGAAVTPAMLAHIASQARSLLHR